jgi:hypothetical protein
VICFKKSATAIVPAALLLLLSIVHPSAQAQYSIPAQIVDADEDLPGVDLSLKTAYQEVTAAKSSSSAPTADSPVFDLLQINDCRAVVGALRSRPPIFNFYQVLAVSSPC